MQILIYSPYSLKFGGGGERWILEIAPRLAKLGHKITIVTTRFGQRVNPLLNLKLPNLVDLVELPFIHLPFFRLLLPIPVKVMNLHKLLKSTDLIYFNNVFPWQELIFLAAKLIYKKSIVNMFQAPIYAASPLRKLYQLIVSRHIVHFSDAHHVLNETDMQILINWKAKNIHYIPNGVATDRFRPTEIPPNAHFNVLFVGRLNYHKGFDILLKIIEVINQDKKLSQNIDFSIIGSGPFKSQAQDLARRYQNVRYLGQINHETLVNFYCSSSLLMIPSRWEGMPLAVLEGQSCGLPIVASDIPGVREIGLGNQSITLVEPEQVNAFAKAIDKYYSLWKAQRSTYARLRQVARENTKDRYDWDKIVALISRLLNG